MVIKGWCEGNTAHSGTLLPQLKPLTKLRGSMHINKLKYFLFVLIVTPFSLPAEEVSTDVKKTSYEELLQTKVLKGHDKMLESLYKTFLFGERRWISNNGGKYIASEIYYSLRNFDKFLSPSGVSEKNWNLNLLSYGKPCYAALGSIEVRNNMSDAGSFIETRLNYRIHDRYGRSGCETFAYFASKVRLDSFSDKVYALKKLTIKEQKLIKELTKSDTIYVKGNDKLTVFEGNLYRIREGKIYNLFQGINTDVINGFSSQEKPFLIVKGGYVADLDNDGNIEIMLSEGTQIGNNTAVYEIVNQKMDLLLNIVYRGEGGIEEYYFDASKMLIHDSETK